MSASAHRGEIALLTLKLDEAIAERDHYRRELGLIRDGARVATIKRAFRLTPLEASVIDRLYQSRSRVMTKAHLFEAAWGDASYDVGAKILDVYICKIRTKLGADFIVTHWGSGYALSDKGIAAVEAALESKGSTQ